MNARWTAHEGNPVAPGPQLVVGFDGSSTAVATIGWAAAEAARHKASLRVVACPAAPPDADDVNIGTRRRDDVVDAVTAVRHLYPQVSITHLDARDALLDAASGADLLIVGPPSSGTAQRCLLGLVPRRAPRRSSCPVIVVRGRHHQPVRRIVVCVDSSNASSTALAWAIDEADLHDAELIVVHAWPRPGGAARSMRRDDLDRADAQCVVDLAVRQAEKRTNRSMRGELIEGEATEVLTAASENADLLAMGSRGRGGFKTMLFGSVALFVAEHAACPVAVIHPRVRSDDPCTAGTSWA